MKVLYATGESYPFVGIDEKSYNSYSFPKEISSFENVDIRVIMPKYPQISEEYTSKFKRIGSGVVNLVWREQKFEIELYENNGIKYYFISNEYYYNRENIYQEIDDCERFAFFPKAVLEAISIIKFYPDIIQCNDTISALIPIYLEKEKRKEEENKKGKLSKIKTIYTFINLDNLGYANKKDLEDVFGLDFEKYSKDEELGFYDSILLLKAGVIYSDIVCVRNKLLSKELEKEEISGELSGFFKFYKKKIIGIRDGVDKEIFDPKTDEKIKESYTYSTIEKRNVNKLALQEELGLKIDLEIPIIVILGNLNYRNGMELIKLQFDAILEEIVEVIVVGNGEQVYEDYFDYYSYLFPDKISTQSAENNFDSLIRKIISGSDIILSPSKSEACRLIDLISMRYGVVPVGYSDSNSKDLITDEKGFLFNNYNDAFFIEKVKEALEQYRNNKLEWNKKVEKCMKTRCTLSQQAKEYMKVYENFKIRE